MELAQLNCNFASWYAAWTLRTAEGQASGLPFRADRLEPTRRPLRIYRQIKQRLEVQRKPTRACAEYQQSPWSISFTNAELNPGPVRYTPPPGCHAAGSSFAPRLRPTLRAPDWTISGRVVLAER